MTMGDLNSSGTPVTHLGFPVLQDDGNNTPSASEFQHFIEFCLILFYIDIIRFIAIGRPGLIRIGSARLTIDNDPFRHARPPDFILVLL